MVAATKKKEGDAGGTTRLTSESQAQRIRDLENGIQAAILKLGIHYKELPPWGKAVLFILREALEKKSR